MHLVDEQHDLAFRALHFVQNTLQPFLELAAIFRARDQAAHVERHQRAVFERVGHVAIGDAECQSLRNRSLAHARVADQHGIILGPPRQNLDCPSDFLVPPDDRVQLALARRFGQVARELLQRIIAIFRARCVRRAAAAQIVDRGVQSFRLHARCRQRLARRRGGREGKRKQQPLDRNKAIARLGRDLLGAVQHPYRVIIKPRRLLRTATRHRRHLGQRRVGLAQRHARVAARRLDQAGRHALIVFQQRFQQMLRTDPLMAHADRDSLRRLQEALGAVSEFFEVHRKPFVKLATM